MNWFSYITIREQFPKLDNDFALNVHASYTELSQVTLKLLESVEHVSHHGVIYRKLG